MKVKVFLGHIMTALFAFFASFIAGSFFGSGTSGLDANTLCSLSASVAIIFGIVSFFLPNRSNKDAFIAGAIYIVLGLAIGGLTAGQQDTYAIVVVGILFAAYGITRVFYYLGYLKGAIKHHRQIILGLSNVLICVGLIAQAVLMVLVQFKVVDITNIAWSKYLFTVLLSVLGAITLIFAIYYFIYFRSLSKKSNNNVKTSGNRNTNTTSTQKDYRSIDKSSISSILYDRCYDIARHYSRTYDVTKGSASFDISVKVSNGKINYVINGKINATDVKDNYDANDFQSSLKTLIENTSNNIINETGSAIEKLRNQYQNYDGEFNMNVEVGNLK